jgi:hypothetical protein
VAHTRGMLVAWIQRNHRSNMNTPPDQGKHSTAVCIRYQAVCAQAGGTPSSACAQELRHPSFTVGPFITGLRV